MFRKIWYTESSVSKPITENIFVMKHITENILFVKNLGTWIYLKALAASVCPRRALVRSPASAAILYTFHYTKMFMNINLYRCVGDGWLSL